MSAALSTKVAIKIHTVRGRAQSATDSSNKTVTAHSKPSAFPSTLRQKHSAVREVRQEDMNTESVIKQTCPQCNREEMRYHTVQLRSADEGSTVFYSCECGYKWVIHIIESVGCHEAEFFVLGSIRTTENEV